MSTPLSLLEAMSAGRPIVASRVGDMPSIVREGGNGLLFDAGNTAQLASKILYILNNKGIAKRLGEEAMRSAEAYDWSKVVQSYIELYSKL
jgi:Glycosyltransferase